MSKEIDYRKPIYINSFAADELIFNTLRGTHVKAVKYDGSLPVSLDCLKIRELCGKSHKKEFPKAFYELGKKKQKTFCDAVINVEFPKKGDFTDVDTIREDLNTILNALKKTLKSGNPEKLPLYITKEDFDSRCKRRDVRKIADNFPTKELQNNYFEFLFVFGKNQNLWKEFKKDKPGSEDKGKEHERLITVKERYHFGQTDLKIKEIKVSVKGTEIKIRVKLRNDTVGPVTIPALFYLCRENENGSGSYKALGKYESEEVDIPKGKDLSIRAALDIRDIMESSDDGKSFIVYEGVYRLFLVDKKNPLPLVSLELGERIDSSTKHENPGWTYFGGDGDIFESNPDTDPPLFLDVEKQLTFKKCGKKYGELLKDGCKELIEKDFKDLFSETARSRLSEAGKDLRCRAILYANGFDFEKDGVVRHYVMYKRSASKSKTGSCLFIWDKLYEEMKQWTWMKKYFEESDNINKYDLTSMKAYEALTLSNIENSFDLGPENILIIDEPKGDNVKGNRRTVCLVKDDEELAIKTKEDCLSCTNKECREKVFEYKNKIWDGQALLDQSVFEKVNGKEKHGMMLLRNHFFKACAFNAKITEYYRKNKISDVYDMFGKRHKAKDIRLIITPDSLKYLKFAKDLYEEKTVGNRKISPKEQAYEHWRSNLKTNRFGIVKYDKPADKSGRHNVGYQILNTLPLDAGDMEELFEHEKKYIQSLWKYDDLFMKIMPKETAKGIYIRKMYEMHGKDFLKTDEYNNYKKQTIDDIKKRLRHGSIDLKGEILTLCSMPYEMLEYSGLTPSKRKITPLLENNEAFIDSDGMKDGDPITLCRYPHLSSGAVCGLKYRNRNEYKRWFNLRNTGDSSSIVIISPYESNIMVKLGGADFDSDTALYLKEAVLQKAAQELTKSDGITKKLCGRFQPEEDGLPVAIACEELEGRDKTFYLSKYDQAKLDHELSNTQVNIGSISNDIQLFNSYLWEGLLSDRDDEYCQTIYECILKMSVLNELEIDRAKHSIEKPLSAFHDEIMKTEYGKGKDRKPILEVYSSGKKVRTKVGTQKGYKEYVREQNTYYHPAFLYENKKDRGTKNIAKRKDKYWNCPPDHLSKLAAGLKKEKDCSDNVKKEVIFNYNAVKGKADYGQENKLKELLKTAVIGLDKLNRRRHKTGEESDERENIRTGFINDIDRMKSIRPKTIAAIVRDATCMKNEDEYYDEFFYINRYAVLGLLLMAEEDKEGGPIWDVFQKFQIIDAPTGKK